MSDRHEPRILIAPRIASRREKVRPALRALIVAATMLAGSSAARAADSPPLDVTVAQDGTVIAPSIGNPLVMVPERSPFGFNILLGEVTHRTDQTDPFDPADQQRNQAHGLTTESWEDVPLRRLFE
jgi:hypothetical protein